jgi:hypothetical protein
LFSLRVSQSGNNISVAVTCHLVACILHNPNLTKLVLDHQPSACEGHDAWRSEGLPVLPSEVVDVSWIEKVENFNYTRWTAALESLREVSMQIIFRSPAQCGWLFFFVLYFFICPLPCQAIRIKYERLKSASPAAKLDCNALQDHQLLLSAVSHAAAKDAGSLFGAPVLMRCECPCLTCNLQKLSMSYPWRTINCDRSMCPRWRSSCASFLL